MSLQTEPISKVLEAFNVLQAINRDNSRLAKESLLSHASDNMFLRLMLQYTYNPYFQYYIRKIPNHNSVSRYTSESLVNNFREFIQLLNRFKDREFTGNNAIRELTNFLNTCSSVESEWYTKIISKDLRIGVSEKTINKVYGAGFIPTFECILADTLKNNSQLPENFCTEPKLDGMRLLAFVYDTGTVVMKSRNGKIIFGFNMVEQELLEKAEAGYVYDGELMSPEFITKVSDLMKSRLNDEEIDLEYLADNSAFNNLMKVAFKKSVDNKEGVFCIFDRVPIEEFDEKISTETMLQRKTGLFQSFKGVELENLLIVPHRGTFHKGEDEEVFETLYEYYLSIGYEGIMVKDITATYQFKRTSKLLKMKPIDYKDLEVVAVEEGDSSGKYAGMLGAVVVDYKGFTTNVGGGFSDEQRKLYWSDPSLIIGKTIMVESQGESSNQNGGLALRFARFKGIREDK